MEPRQNNWSRILLKNLIISIVLDLLLFLLLTSFGGGVPLIFILYGTIAMFVVLNIIEYIYYLTYVTKNSRPIILGFSILIIMSFLALILFVYILK